MSKRTVGLIRTNAFLSPYLVVASLSKAMDLNGYSVSPLVPTEEKATTQSNGKANSIEAKKNKWDGKVTPPLPCLLGHIMAMSRIN